MGRERDESTKRERLPDVARERLPDVARERLPDVARERLPDVARERLPDVARERLPDVALTIAGLDPSGGAGLAADLRAFRAAGVWGAAACAVLTVQSTRGLASAHPVAGAVLRAQAVHVLSDLNVRAMKVGALGSEENARVVTELLLEYRLIPAVVDPVMVPSRALSEGARLDGRASHDALWALVRAAALVTPNADEASALLGRAVRTAREGRAAAEDLVRAGTRAALVKGGHLDGERAIDWLATGRSVIAIERARRAVPPLHGAGCTLSALIAGRLAMRSAPGPATDEDLLTAVRWARSALDRALRAPLAVGGGARVLDVGARPRVAPGPRRTSELKVRATGARDTSEPKVRATGARGSRARAASGPETHEVQARAASGPETHEAAQ